MPFDLMHKTVCACVCVLCVCACIFAMIIDLWCVKFVSVAFRFVFVSRFFFQLFFVSLLIVYKYGQKRGHEAEGFPNGQHS